jgi:hypothetical protein
VSLSRCNNAAVLFQEIPAHTGAVSALVSAQLHRRLRGRIAIASLLHRRRIAVASPHRIAATSRRWRLAESMLTSLELHLPVVHPTCCTRTEEVEPPQLALGEAMMRTHLEVMIERL